MANVTITLAKKEMLFLEQFLDTASPWGESDDDHDLREKIYLKIAIANKRANTKDQHHD